MDVCQERPTMTMTSIENNNIKVFLDTNVVIDALTLRDYDYGPSKAVLYNVVKGAVTGYICSKQITDIYYIFRKYYQNEDDIRTGIKKITSFFEILPLFKGDILACLNTEMPDFEDAILYEVAKVNMIPIIVTNNINHFKGCQKMVLTPQQFLDLYSLE